MKTLFKKNKFLMFFLQKIFVCKKCFLPLQCKIIFRAGDARLKGFFYACTFLRLNRICNVYFRAAVSNAANLIPKDDFAARKTRYFIFKIL